MKVKESKFADSIITTQNVSGTCDLACEETYVIPQNAVVFPLSDLYEIISGLHKSNKYDALFCEDELVAYKKGKSILTVGYIRFVVPELGISFRSGNQYYSDDVCDSVILYERDERDYRRIKTAYTNTSVLAVLSWIASEKGVNSYMINKTVCYYNPDEIFINDDISKQYSIPFDTVRVVLPALAEVKKRRTASDSKIAAVLKSFMINGMSYTAIERDVLGLDIEKTKGYTVMNMLKQYGVTKEFKGVFMGVRMKIVFANLKVSGNQYDEIRTLLGDKH